LNIFFEGFGMVPSDRGIYPIVTGRGSRSTARLENSRDSNNG